MAGCKPAPKPTLVDQSAVIRQLRDDKEKLQEEAIEREQKLHLYRIGFFGVGAILLGFLLSKHSAKPAPNADKDTPESGGVKPNPQVEADWYPSSNGLIRAEPLTKCPGRRHSGNEVKNHDLNWAIAIDGNGITTRNGSFRAERLLSLIVALQSRKLDYGIVFDQTAARRAAAVGAQELRVFELLRKGAAGPCIIQPGGVLHLKGLTKRTQVVSNDPDLPRLFTFRRDRSEQHVRFHRVFFSSRSFRTTLMRNKPLPLFDIDDALRRLTIKPEKLHSSRPRKHVATAV